MNSQFAKLEDFYLVRKISYGGLDKFATAFRFKDVAELWKDNHEEAFVDISVDKDEGELLAERGKVLVGDRLYDYSGESKDEMLCREFVDKMTPEQIEAYLNVGLEVYIEVRLGQGEE